MSTIREIIVAELEEFRTAWRALRSMRYMVYSLAAAGVLAAAWWEASEVRCEGKWDAANYRAFYHWQLGCLVILPDGRRVPEQSIRFVVEPFER